MFPDSSFSFNGNENPFIKILTDVYRGSNSIDYMLQQDDKDYKNKINKLK